MSPASPPINLPILFEDDAILAINKPSGLVVNRTNTYSGQTLQDYIEQMYELRSVDVVPNEEETEFSLRSGIVHRLDKDTTGVLLIAKTAKVFGELQKQFKLRLVKKEYLALVVGEIKQKHFIVNAPLARDPKNKLKVAVVREGREAQTEFYLIKTVNLNGEIYSYVKAEPRTGRTHQIRVHLVALNHPVAGDRLYMTQKQLESSVNTFPRALLHATSILFTHPETKKQLTIVAEVPKDFPDHI